MMQAEALVVLLLSAAVAAGCVFLMRPVSHRVGLIDRPNARKAHSVSTPRVGGLAIVAGLLLSLWLLPFERGTSHGFLIGLMILVAGGLLDDKYELSPRVKLIFHLAAVLVMWLVGGLSIHTLGSILPGIGPVELGVAAVTFTIVASVACINAVNLYDGLDGLAGFQALVAFGALAFLAAYSTGSIPVELLLIIGGMIGFLGFNARVPGRQCASVFLGDVGSNLIGFAYVWFVVQFSNGPEPFMAPVTALWLLMLPILDTVTVMVRRLRRGNSPFKPDKEHLHHVFLMAGFSVGQTVMIMTAVSFAAASFGLAGELIGIPDSVMFGVFVALSLTYLAFLLRAWGKMQFLWRSICRRSAAGDRRKQSSSMGPKVLPAGFERRSGFDRRDGQRKKRDRSRIDRAK